MHRANCLRWAAANIDAIEYVQKLDDLDPVISSTATDWRVCTTPLPLLVQAGTTDHLCNLATEPAMNSALARLHGGREA